MADGQDDGVTMKRQSSSEEEPHRDSPETGSHGNSSTGTSLNQQSTSYSPSQEPWNVLWYWMSVHYYQQYYYQLCSYVYYWQTVASQSMYQGTFQTQSSYSQSILQNQGSQPGLYAGQARQNTANVENGHVPRPPMNGGVFLPGRAVPWTYPGQPSVTTVSEVQIAPVSRRIYAEILDFIFLYLTKILVFSIYDDLEKYNQLQYTLLSDDEDLNLNIQDIQVLLVQALVYRLLVFAYEVFFLMGGLHGSVGGATPGKYLMGLSVIATDHISTVATDPAGDRVRIIPGGNLGFWRSFLRALLKNFSMTFLFPVFLTVLIFEHSRAAYDVISNSTVVVTSAAPPRQQANQLNRRQ